MVPKVGQTASVSKTITQEHVQRFADLVGDNNPIHLDPAYAAKTRFGKPIAHGMWGASLISNVIGSQLPGPGSIYLSQSLRFEAPVYMGDTITATATVASVREDRPIVTLETVCTNQDEKVILSGEAVVLVEESR